MPAYHLRTFYLGKQSAWGSSATATARLEGVTDGNVTVNIQDEVIDTIGWNVGNITMQQLRDSEITVSLVATYEQILYILHGLLGSVTPIPEGSLYKYIYTVPKANTVIPQLYTIYYGIENDIYELHSCVIKEVTIKGEVRNYLELEVTFISPNAPVPSTLPTVTQQNVTIINVKDSEFFLSDLNTFPTLTNPVEATLISFEITINPNRHIKHFIGNSTSYGDGKWQIEGSLNVEFNTASKTVINSVLSTVTEKYLGLRFLRDGNKFLIAIPLIINDSIELFSDRDGNATVELSIKAVYGSLNDTALFLEVINGIDTLP